MNDQWLCFAGLVFVRDGDEVGSAVEVGIGCDVEKVLVGIVCDGLGINLSACEVEDVYGDLRQGGVYDLDLQQTLSVVWVWEWGEIPA